MLQNLKLFHMTILKALDGMGSPIEGIIIVKSKDIFCFSTDELTQ